ncbi:MAG: hypothetical protein IT169_10290 [Bryobacterales bacterium]|nr:hypothetical protein [Bryobacterales bacterium]
MRIRVYNEKGQSIGSGWAIPVDGAYVTVRGLLANAARAELVLPGDLRVPVAEVGGEDIEGNLVLITVSPLSAPSAGSAGASGAPPAPRFTLSTSLSQFPREPQPQPAEVAVVCDSASYPLRERRIRDIPVFGLAFVSDTKHREPIAGCPVLDREGAVEAIVVWEDPFGRPSAVLVPAARAARLGAGPRIPWDQWRKAQQEPERRLRDSLLSEAISDIWREHYDLAQENLTFLLEQNPTDARGWYYRGYSRAMSGKRKLALTDYENAVYFEPANAEARFSLGFTYALLHRIPDARRQVAVLESLDSAMAERLRTVVDAIGESNHEGDRTNQEGLQTLESPSVAEPVPELPPR